MLAFANERLHKTRRMGGLVDMNRETIRVGVLSWMLGGQGRAIRSAGVVVFVDVGGVASSTVLSGYQV